MISLLKICRITPILVMLSVLVSGTHGQSVSSNWNPAKAPVMTKWTSVVKPENSWPEYPRPQLVREKWMNLNGLWDYAIRFSNSLRRRLKN